MPMYINLLTASDELLSMRKLYRLLLLFDAGAQHDYGMNSIKYYIKNNNNNKKYYFVINININPPANVQVAHKV